MFCGLDKKKKLLLTMWEEKKMMGMILKIDLGHSETVPNFDLSS